MAKVRIKYEVDESELKLSDKELKKIREDVKKIEEGFSDTNKEVKNSKTSLIDLKGAVANIGITAVVGAAIISFAKLTQEINKSRKEVAQLTKETGKSLDLITAKVRATSKAFDKDFTEILRAANAVSKNLGITMVDTMDQINDAMARGLDINGEYLETISEYSPFMKQAGIDFQQFNVLIQKQLTDGVFSDKGIDAIKEAVISIQEMTPATRDALKAVGLNTNQIIKDIESGAKTYFEVIQDIGRSLEDITDQTVRGQVLADVFRGAGEDAGDFALTLHEVGTEYEDLTEEQEKFRKNQIDLVESSEDLNLELIKLTKNIGPLGTAWKTFLNDAGAGTLKFVNDLIIGFDNLEKEINSYRESVKTLTIEEQADELAKLESSVKNLQNSLKPASDQFKKLFGLDGDFQLPEKTPEQIDEINDKIDTLTSKIGVLKQIETDRTDAAKKANEELNALIEKERLAREAAIKRDAKAAADAKLKEDKKNATIGAKSLAELKKQLAREEEDELKILREEFTLSIDEQAIQDEKELNEELVKINKQRLDKIAKDEQDALDLKAEREQFAVDIGVELARSFVDLQVAELIRQGEENEAERNAQLALVEGNKDAEDSINRKFNAKQDQLRSEQKEKEKQQAVISILLNSSQAALKGIALFGPPPSPLGIAALAAVGVITALQLGAVAKLKDGVIGIKGPGTTTSDSIPAMLSVEESVMTAAETKAFRPTLQAIRNREISPDIMNNIAMHQDTQPRTIVYDYEKLAKAVMNQPQKSLVADENGFTGYIIRQGKSLEKKQAKYNM